VPSYDTDEYLGSNHESSTPFSSEVEFDDYGELILKANQGVTLIILMQSLNLIMNGSQGLTPKMIILRCKISNFDLILEKIIYLT